MRVEENQVRQLTITGVQHLDPIRVMIEDLGPRCGRITIICWDDAWTNTWNGLGSDTMAEFFSRVDTDYLALKMKSGIRRTLIDEDSIEQGCRKEVLKMRREKDIDKEEAERLWDRIEWADFQGGQHTNHDLYYDIFGDEWWYRLPEHPNPEYLYLVQVIETVQEALR